MSEREDGHGELRGIRHGLSPPGFRGPIIRPMLAGLGGFGYARRAVRRPARIYLASPLGFSEAGRHFYEPSSSRSSSGLGFEVLDPWTLTERDADRRRVQSHAVRARQARGVAERSTSRWAPPIARRSTRRTRVVAVLDGVGRRQRHRGRDRLRVRARQADRRLSRRLPPERRQRGQHRQPPGRVLHPRERRAPSSSATRISAPALAIAQRRRA